MSDQNFYKSLPVLASFAGLADAASFSPAPGDWAVAVTDIEESGRAIERGLYKEVNLINASAILTILNVCGFEEVPFVFGGDGATALVPPRQQRAVHTALLAARTMAKQEFGLRLRVGLLPVSAIRELGRDLRVAKVQISPHFSQAAFAGGGAALAEELLKTSPGHPAFQAEPKIEAKENPFDGLECRWERIASSRDEIVAIIVQAVAKDEATQQRVYGEVLRQIENIYGDPDAARPVNPQKMRLTVNHRNLRCEHRVRSFGKSFFYRLWHHLELRLMVLTGKVFMKTGIQAAGAKWSDYKRIASENTDFRKFDDQVKQVLAGTVAQREALTTWLEEKRLAGELFYGIQASPSAFITCLISDYHTRHFHLVDGAEGGYTLAAKKLKAQARQQRPTGEVKDDVGVVGGR